MGSKGTEIVKAKLDVDELLKLLNKAYADYDRHNTQELLKILNALESERGAFSRHSIPGAFLFKKRSFGPIYEFWARNVYLPMGLSRFMNRFLGKSL